MGNFTNLSHQTTSTESQSRSHMTIVIQVTSMAFLGVVIVLGNLASIVIFLKTRSLRKRCHFLIVSLSVADFLIGLTDFMDMHTFVHGKRNVDINFLESLAFFYNSAGTVSILTLTSIAIERFCAVVYPFYHRRMRIRVYIALIVIPWLVAMVITGLYYYKPRIRIYRGFYVGVPLMGLIMILVLYTGIAIRMQRQKYSFNADRDQNRTIRNNQKLSVTLFLITLASFSCWLPMQCFLALYYFCSSCSFPNFMNYLFFMVFLKYCNSGVNILIYIARIRDFRHAFVSYFRKCFCYSKRDRDPNPAVVN